MSPSETEAPRTVAWNPADYAANSAQQHLWARELIARLDLRGDERILDVGCGDGKVTAELAGCLPRGSVMGIDASSQMIAFAQKAFGNGANLAFQVMDARRIRLPREFDVVFSNAALHWVDDHREFLRGASACLRSGGRLFTSCGGKGNAQEIFLALRPELRRQRWREYFRKMETPYFFYAPADYGRWLPGYGFTPVRVELVPKEAMFPGRDGFAAWLRTTWLPYTQRVPEELREEFTSAVVDRYVAKHPPDADGRVHVRMLRLEIEAIKT